MCWVLLIVIVIIELYVEMFFLWLCLHAHDMVEITRHSLDTVLPSSSGRASWREEVYIIHEISSLSLFSSFSTHISPSEYSTHSVLQLPPFINYFYISTISSIPNFLIPISTMKFSTGLVAGVVAIGLQVTYAAPLVITDG